MQNWAHCESCEKSIVCDIYGRCLFNPPKEKKMELVTVGIYGEDDVVHAGETVTWHITDAGYLHIVRFKNGKNLKTVYCPGAWSFVNDGE